MGNEALAWGLRAWQPGNNRAQMTKREIKDAFLFPSNLHFIMLNTILQAGFRQVCMEIVIVMVANRVDQAFLSSNRAQ